MIDTLVSILVLGTLGFILLWVASSIPPDDGRPV